MSVVLFDMDGVLVDTEGVYLTRFKEFLEYKGYHISDKILNHFVGSNSRLDKQLFAEYIDSNINYDEFVKERKKYFINRPVDYSTVLFSDVVETLKGLKKKGHHLTVVSSSPKWNINLILNQHQLLPYFDYIISGEDFSESKPNPQVYLYAKHLYCDLNQKVYVVEDSTIGIEAAYKANTIVIARKDNRFGFNQSKANYIVDSICDVLKIVK